MGASHEAQRSQELQELSSAIFEVTNRVAGSLSAARIPTEALATLVPARRVLLWNRPTRMDAIGEVWRLGTLLLSPHGDLYAAGQHTRAAQRGRPGYQSVSREERREIAAAALRGGFADGSPVNFAATPLVHAQTSDPHDAATGDTTAAIIGEAIFSENSPLGLVNGEVRVRWNATAPIASGPTLETYLAERASLLINPPQAAT